MTERPLVSVVIPCFNQARYLVEAIESVLGQTYPRVEVIAVDDGSTDATPAVLAGFGERVHVVRQENRGLSGARNTGLEHARGDYVVFLDSDDLLCPNIVAEGLKQLEATSGAIVIWNYAKFTDAEGLASAEEVVPADGDSLAAILCRTGFAVHAAMFERRLIPGFRPFDEALRSHEDYDYWWKLALEEPRCARLHRLGAYYRQHSAAMSRDLLRMWRTRTEVQLRVIDRLLNRPTLAAKCGKLFATSLLFSRRQLIVLNAEGELVDRAWAGLQRLRDAGYRAEHGWLLSPVYQSLGSKADSLMIAVARRLRPHRFPPR